MVYLSKHKILLPYVWLYYHHALYQVQSISKSVIKNVLQGEKKNVDVVWLIPNFVIPCLLSLYVSSPLWCRSVLQLQGLVWRMQTDRQDLAR